MRKILALMLGVVVFCTTLHAQETRAIAGRVTDQLGEPVVGASVLVKGTRTGTTTTADGSFALSVPANATTLVISSVGFSPMEVSIVNQTTVTAVLTSVQGGLEEVVVVGYTQRRKRDEAGAISTIRAQEIENVPVSSLDRALQGRAAGVVVQSNNGIPGGAVTVRVRGYGSITAGNAPLYIVDGVQLNTNNTTTFTQSNPLAFLNPNDIESIDILKDAASAAIYGSAASNGVVIITTKKGRAGQTRFTFNTYYGQARPLKKLDVVNSQEYFQLRTEAVGNFNNLAANNIAVLRNVLINDYRFPAAQVNTWDAKTIDSVVAAVQTYDWQDQAFRTGSIKNYELGISGGNERTTFRLSGNFNTQDAIVTKADFKRAGLNFNLSNKATDKLTVSTGVSLSTFDQQGPFGGGGGASLGNIAFSASGILPMNPIYNEDGTYYGMPGQNPSNLSGVLSQNAVAVNDLNRINQRTNQLVGNIQGEYQLLPWLSFRSFYSLDYRNVNGNSWWDPRTGDGFARGGLGQTSGNFNTNFLTNQIFNVRQVINDVHNFDAQLGYEYRRENFQSIFFSGDGFPTPYFTTLGTAANPVSINQTTSQFRRQGVFTGLNYSFDGRYIVGLVARYDGSSRFGEENKYGFFPGIKLGWNIDRESFMEGATAISALRLRASYGATGNDQIGNFSSLGLYGGGVVYGGRAGLTYNQLANPVLGWEANNTVNLGLDFGFLRNRISGAVEVYNRKTSELLLDQLVSWTTGFSDITSNVGQVQNRGVEVTLNTGLLRSTIRDGFNWNTTFTMGYNKSKLLQLYGETTNIGTAYVVGQPLFLVQSTPYAGVNPATGRPMWYDSLGNITYQIQTPKDNRIIGDQLPEFTGGLNNSFTYKGFSLDVFFSYEYGRLANDGQINFLSEASGRINFLQNIYENRWTTPGQITSVPRMNLAAEQKSSGVLAGDRTWFKGDFVRLRNVSLGYDLPTSVISRVRMASAKFYIQGTNLYTWTAAPSYDPEFLGAGTGQIPNSKNIIVGLQIGF
jgi:TonB-dependent starch-binding outer membrane protein SusC